MRRLIPGLRGSGGQDEGCPPFLGSPGGPSKVGEEGGVWPDSNVGRAGKGPKGSGPSEALGVSQEKGDEVLRMEKGEEDLGGR